MRQIPVFENPFMPTLVQELAGLRPGNRIFLKREDLLPFSFGGNKVRKARHFYREIREQGIDVVMTYGSSSSNHCRIIANMAAAMGLPCHIISPEENYHETANSRLVEQFGAVIEKAPLEQISQTIEARKAAYRQAGKKPYFILGGGHGDPGTEGYRECYAEICDWEAKNGIAFDYIFHVSGTGATQAGLVCGQLLAGREQAQKIVGLSNARTTDRGRPVVAESILSWLTHRTADAAYWASPAGQERLENALHFVDDWRLGGYGNYNDSVLEVIRLAMREYGVPMDTTYVGKGFWGMLEYVKTRGITGKNILFLHTGGTPLFFDLMEED